MHDDNPDESASRAAGSPDPQVAALLSAAARRRRAKAGPEAKDLEAVARWIDGELSPEKRAEVAARIDADPELRAAVEALAQHDVRGSEAGTRLAPVLPANVVSLADHARRVAADTRGKAERATGRAASRVLIGGGSILLLAAILFLATRPASQAPTSLQGASVGADAAGGAIGLRASLAPLAPGKPCEVSGVLSAEADKALWYVTLEGAEPLGSAKPGPFRFAPTCAPSTCEALVATPLGAKAPTLDPTTCAPTDPGHAAIRLTR